ncbi:MAG: enoyl-CoA hydratase/isomerase family protein [Solirubrobacterales bacterium]
MSAESPIALAIDGRVARLTISNPPVNLLGEALLRDFKAALDEIESDPGADIVLVESGVAGFFAAHYDVEEILSEDAASVRTAIGPFNRLMERIRTSRLVTIAKVRGAARGGGCELLQSFDMRFASRQLAVFAQPEAMLGIIAAGGATQRLPQLIGRARALELLLGGDDIDAKTAETYGLVNRALPDETLDQFVDDLIDRLAETPPRALAMAKLAVDAAVDGWSAGFALEALELDLLKGDPSARERMRRFIEAGGQSRSGELHFQRTVRAASNASNPYGAATNGAANEPEQGGEESDE